MSKKGIICLVVGTCLLVALFTTIIVFAINSPTPVTVHSNRAVVDVDISEIKDPEWFDYSYFWTSGKDEYGHELTIVTIYWTKAGEEGVTTYVTNGTSWEELK